MGTLWKDKSESGNMNAKLSELGNPRFAVAEGIATITLTGPHQLNILHEDLIEAMCSILDEIATREDIQVVVLLSASEKVFSAGADIKTMADLDPAAALEFAELGHRLTRKIERLPQPVIIGIGGLALGGAVEIACACDIRIGSESAIFAQPEIDIGIIPGWGGTQRLARVVGIPKARELIYLGRRVDAQEALLIGLVNQVVPDYLLESVVMEMAVEMARKSRVALFDAKEAINRVQETFLEEGLAFERQLWSGEFGRSDQQEGMRAFLERREPKYQDR